MSTYKRKSKFKSIIGAVLGIALLVGSVAGVAAFAKRDTKTIGSSAFSRGAVNIETGSYEKSETTLYTEDLIPCVGLEITPDFDSDVSYRVFFYNMDKQFIGYTKEYKDAEVFANSVPDSAWYCRIMLIPSGLDEDGKAIKDFKIKFWETYKYASDLKIKVAKDQSESVHNIYANAPSYNLSGEYDASSTINLLAKYNGAFIVDNYVVNDMASPETLLLSENEEFHCLFIDVRAISELYIDNKDDVFVHLYAYNEEDGTITKSGYYSVAPGESVVNDVSFNVSDFAVISLNGEPGLDIGVYNYMPREITQIG